MMKRTSVAKATVSKPAQAENAVSRSTQTANGGRRFQEATAKPEDVNEWTRLEFHDMIEEAIALTQFDKVMMRLLSIAELTQHHPAMRADADVLNGLVQFDEYIQRVRKWNNWLLNLTQDQQDATPRPLMFPHGTDAELCRRWQ